MENEKGFSQGVRAFDFNQDLCMLSLRKRQVVGIVLNLLQVVCEHGNSSANESERGGMPGCIFFTDFTLVDWL